MSALFQNKPKWTLDTVTGRDAKDKAVDPYAGIKGGAGGMSAKQRKDFRARESAKIDSVFTSSRYSG